ncbi:MAG: hypothetical protein E4G99_06630 [Anaerolineales bacterium]|nr:MAG: hypothetical protein E4G99_06630 [Anaerolineales bacterium]
MRISSSQVRLLVISSLVLIAVVVVVRLTIGEKPQVGPAIQNDKATIPLRSYMSPGDRGTTASIDPCTLIEKGEIEAEIGRPVGEPQSGYADNPLGERYCRFPDPEAQDIDLFNYSIVFNASIDPPLLRDGYSVLRMFEGRKVSPDLIQVVENLGDDAFWGGSGKELWNGLHILVHDVYLQVKVNSGNELMDYRIAQNVAVAALERLFTD